MTKTEFIREDRYVVLKRTDLDAAFTRIKDQNAVGTFWSVVSEARLSRQFRNANPYPKFLVIEEDWPEYEPTWKVIEERIGNTETLEHVDTEMIGETTANCFRMPEANAMDIFSGGLMSLISWLPTEYVAKHYHDDVLYATIYIDKEVSEPVKLNVGRLTCSSLHFFGTLFVGSGRTKFEAAEKLRETIVRAIENFICKADDTYNIFGFIDSPTQNTLHDDQGSTVEVIEEDEAVTIKAYVGFVGLHNTKETTHA